jgi:hypothetical protein
VAQLIVGMTSTLAAALARGDRTEAVARLHELTEQAGVELRPESTSGVRPSRAPDETIWHWADLGDEARGGALSEALVHVPGVTAAYVKPGEELP